VAKRREYLPLKRSPPEPHPDSGVLLEVRITGKATATRTRQSYVHLCAPLLVARENLVGLPRGTVKLEPRAFAIVLDHLRRVCPDVIVPLAIKPLLVVSPAPGGGRGKAEEEEDEWIEESPESESEVGVGEGKLEQTQGTLADRPALVATVVLASRWWRFAATHCTVTDALPHFRKNKRDESQGIIRHRRPRACLPHGHIPHGHLPHDRRPHVFLSHARLPHVFLPHARLPHACLPHIRLPHACLPHARLPYPRRPYAHRPHVRRPPAHRPRTRPRLRRHHSAARARAPQAPRSPPTRAHPRPRPARAQPHRSLDLGARPRSGRTHRRRQQVPAVAARKRHLCLRQRRRRRHGVRGHGRILMSFSFYYFLFFLYLLCCDRSRRYVGACIRIYIYRQLSPMSPVLCGYLFFFGLFDTARRISKRALSTARPSAAAKSEEIAAPTRSVGTRYRSPPPHL